jgi:hypothetical protein
MGETTFSPLQVLIECYLGVRFPGVREIAFESTKEQAAELTTLYMELGADVVSEPDNSRSSYVSLENVGIPGLSKGVLKRR